MPSVNEFVKQHSVNDAADLLGILLVDQHNRWRAGCPIPLGEYFEQHPLIGSEPVFRRQLIVEEFGYREDYSGDTDIEGFLAQFSHFPPEELRDIRALISEEDSGDALHLAETQTETPTEQSRHMTALAQPEGEETAGATKTSQNTPKSIGRYEVLRVLGEGGFATVYLARDRDLDREVALKVPRLDRFRRTADLELFVDEARKAAQLDHPRIVRVYDVQREPDRVCIVQQYLAGGDLSTYVSKDRVPPRQAAELMVDIAEAVGYAHQLRYIHLDLKPANILLDGAGKPHVADFGLALHESRQAEMQGAVLGTYAYMSPAQVRGETHRLDGRADIWSLGVIFYELLTGLQPFRAKTRRELVGQIQRAEPRPPRQLDPQIPRELSRICLVCLSKRASDRYAATADLVDDLRHWLKGSQFTTKEESPSAKERAGADQFVKIIPQGLRSFGPEHADYYLQLLPGPHDRDGLPPQVRFWKSQIENVDPDETFSVGLMYGPSGCGKSSLVRAGLLPRLSEDVVPIYVEATSTDTELRLLKSIRKHDSELHSGDDPILPEMFANLRINGGLGGRKVLIVIDQFEQWLHANEAQLESQLLDGLRQCDGVGVQCLLMIRDDFWMSATRLMQALEIPLVEGRNTAAVDLFDSNHAEKVLVAFGAAYGRLPQPPAELAPEQLDLVKQATEALANDGKVVCVQLAAFAEMMKARAWTVESLQTVGGAEGVGVTFLEETFSGKAAPITHRQHQKAVGEVLRAMLPDQGADIKAEMKSYDELLRASGYAQRPESFEALLAILDGGTRLVTPTDPDEAEGPGATNTVDTQRARYYQLTHDFLVPSMRQWLTRKQRETRRGRAELRLAEQASLYAAQSEKRHLPSLLVWLNISLCTEAKRWTPAQRRMMHMAAQFHAVVWGTALALLMLVGFAVTQLAVSYERQANADRVITAVNAMSTASGSSVSYAIRDLQSLPMELVLPAMQEKFQKEAISGQPKLSLAYGMAALPDPPIESLDVLIAGIVDQQTSSSETMNIVSALESFKDAIDKLDGRAQVATTQKKWREKARLATVAWHLGSTSLAREMLQAFPEEQYRPKLPDLLNDLERQLATLNKRPDAVRNASTNRLNRAVANYYLNRPQEALADLTVLAEAENPPLQAVCYQAICLAIQGAGEEARIAVERLKRMPGAETIAFYSAIVAECALGNEDEANRLLDELLRDNPEDATVHYNAARIAAQLSRFDMDEAAANKRKAVTLLQRAYVELGYADETDARQDVDFIPLHEEPDFQALINKVFPGPLLWDPVQRTRFISEFAVWSGDLEALAAINGPDNPSFRSGVALAVGSISPSESAKRKWTTKLSRWRESASDSGTHGAAEWALRRWGIPVEPLSIESRPKAESDYWPIESDLTMVRIRPGLVQGYHGIIRVPKQFWLSDREVTVQLFQRFIDATEWKWEGAESFNLPEADQLPRPVQKVSWYDAARFCNWLSNEHGLDAYYSIEASVKKPEEYVVTTNEGASGFRLPKPSEWEYACRALTSTKFFFGEAERDLSDYGVYAFNSESRTASPRSKKCNSWGLFDMHGNVSEWCEGHEGRGGSWLYTAVYGASSYRGRYHPTFRFEFLGFRVAAAPLDQAGKGDSP